MIDTDIKSSEMINISGNGSKSSQGDVVELTSYVDPELERHALRKFDKYLLPPLALILLLAYLDRSNLGEST